MGSLANSEDPDEMLHNFIRVYTVCYGKKDPKTKNTILF